MLVDFDTIPNSAKLWVYPSSRKFYPQEIEELQNELETFISSWKSDDGFKTSFKVLYNRFIIFTADDSESILNLTDIDKSVAFILSLEQRYSVTLLDKMNVCFKQGEYVQYKELKEFKKLLKNKAVTGKSIIFDNTISNKGDFEDFWEVPIENSWYNRFLK